MFGGYPSHKHYNPFLDEIESAYELFEYEYPGQWWHLGSLSAKIILAFLVPLWIYWRMRYVQVKRAEKGQVGFGNPHNYWTEGVFQMGEEKW